MQAETICSGPFSWNGIEVRGPEPYMTERGAPLLDTLLASGEDLDEAGVLDRLVEDWRYWTSWPLPR